MSAITPAITRTSASRRCGTRALPEHVEQMTALAEQCMSEYDENGWTDPAWLDPDDVAYPGLPGERRAAE